MQFLKIQVKVSLPSRLPVYNWSHLPKISKTFLLQQNNSPPQFFFLQKRGEQALFWTGIYVRELDRGKIEPLSNFSNSFPMSPTPACYWNYTSITSGKGFTEAET